MTSSAYERTGRIRQKARTRRALVAATRELLAEGTTPSVEQAADRADVSRTTAYRYFPNRRALIVATYPEIESQSLLGDQPPTDPLARVDLATETLTRQLIDHEQELRAQLRLSLESPPPERGELVLRQGRAIAWFEEALSPLRDRLSSAELRRLVLAVRAAVGIEPLVWLTDVAGLSREDAVEVMRSSARTLVAAAMLRSPNRAPSRPTRD